MLLKIGIIIINTKKMKEIQITHREDTNAHLIFLDQKKAIQKKFSIQIEEAFIPQSPNFYSFSRIADQQFLNSANSLRSFELLQNQMPSLVDYATSPELSDNSIENLNSCANCSTPTSFGFSESAYRVACVTIKHVDFEKTFPNTNIYLVNDIHDPNKAGLLFKYQGVQVDLKIEKHFGKQLQRNGQIKNMACQLWVDDSTQWIQVQANIVLFLM